MIKKLNKNIISKVLYYPIYTEKALNLQKINKYTFIVQKKYKISVIKSFFEFLFNIKILKINSYKFSYKNSKKNYKKIIITIKPYQLIVLLSYIHKL